MGAGVPQPVGGGGLPQREDAAAPGAPETAAHLLCAAQHGEPIIIHLFCTC